MGKTARVIFCGMKGVGKTAILEQAIYGNYSKESVSLSKLNICTTYYWEC